MPTYEYKCEKCGQSFEKFQNMSADPLKECPKCGGKVRRLIGAGIGIISKGNEIHAVDYGCSSSEVLRPRCGRDRPCCGRDVPCGKCKAEL